MDNFIFSWLQSVFFPSSRSLITSDTEGITSGGHESENNDLICQFDNVSQSESLLSGASSDVEEGNNADNKNKR